MDYGPEDEIVWDDPVPPYRQLAGILRSRIARGDWQPRRPIPGEQKIADEFGLARVTVRKAIAALVEDGVLFVVPRRGTYVAERPEEAPGDKDRR